MQLFTNMLYASRCHDKRWCLFFFLYFSVIIEYFPPPFAGNCSLATLASQQAQTTCDSSGITLFFTFKLAKWGWCTSLLDRHFFNYVLMLTISTEVASAIPYWYTLCLHLFSTFCLNFLTFFGHFLLRNICFVFQTFFFTKTNKSHMMNAVSLKMKK